MNFIAFILSLVFFLSVVLYLLFKEQINIFLFPDDYNYIFMESDDKIKIWQEKVKDKSSFKYKNGVYYFDIPQKRKVLTVPKNEDKEDDAQEVKGFEV